MIAKVATQDIESFILTVFELFIAIHNHESDGICSLYHRAYEITVTSESNTVELNEVNLEIMIGMLYFLLK